MENSINTTEFLFIDVNVDDKQTLIDNAAANVKVVELNNQTDVLTQIATALQGQTNLNAIHIISHGSEGELNFANGTLNSANLSTYATQLKKIGASLSKDGDILLYGCDVAKGDDGSAFINSLSKLTQADVAASNDLTGAASLGGDWVLENHTGAIEANTLTVANWHDVLGIPTLDTVNSTPADNGFVSPNGSIVLKFSEALTALDSFSAFILYDETGTERLTELFEFRWSNNSHSMNLESSGTLSEDTITLTPASGLLVAGHSYCLKYYYPLDPLQSLADSQSLSGWEDTTYYNFTVTPPMDLVTTSDSGSSSTDNITNVVTPTIRVPLSSSGALQGDTIELKLAGNSLGTPQTKMLDATDISNGYVEFTVTSGDLGANGDKVFTAALTDQQGTPVTTTLSGDLTITLDTIAPTATAPIESIQNTANAVVQSNETGTAYLVKWTLPQPATLAALTTLESENDNSVNHVAISSANSNTNLAATGLVDGNYKVYQSERKTPPFREGM